MENTIQENIRHIMERINTACKKAGRDPKEVQLLLATKTVEPERILQAFSCGCTLIRPGLSPVRRKQGAGAAR